jgi:hypothetical protein
LLATSRVGRSRILHANMTHPLARPLTEILDYIYGPQAVIAEEFSRIPGTSRLLIFGSWAARHSGEPGHVPRDIDVLLVGDANRSLVYAAADRAQERTGIPVNAVLASDRRWESEADTLIRQIKSGPTIDLTAQIAALRSGEAARRAAGPAARPTSSRRSTAGNFSALPARVQPAHRGWSKPRRYSAPRRP